MAQTNFGALTQEQITIWSKDLWRQARNNSFIDKFLGEDANSVIQRVSELKKTEKGDRAVITLLADLLGDGVAGDRTLEGREEALQTFDTHVTYDMIRHANRNTGRMADQRTIVDFRKSSRDVLAYWLSDRIDQMAFLTLAGVGYDKRPDGSARPVGSGLIDLEFAKLVTPSTDKRRARWNKSSGRLEFGGATTDLTATDKISWAMLVELKAQAKLKRIRGVREDGGEETFHVFLNPSAMASLKLDPDYMANLRHAAARDPSNPLFSGTTVKIDGLYLHEFRYVYNTLGALPGAKWGADGTVDGCSVLFCGAQALGMADIADPEWVEEMFDYKNQVGIATGKMLGFLKPQFETIYEPGGKQDFGCLNIYVAI